MLGFHRPAVSGRVLTLLGLLVRDAVGLKRFGAVEGGAPVFQLGGFDWRVARGPAVQVASPFDSGAWR